MKRSQSFFKLTVMIALLSSVFPGFAGETADSDRLLSVARTMIESVPNCMLISIDNDGYPVARVMDPFTPDSNMVIWFGTNRHSRKVDQIKKNPKVSVFYQGLNGTGYVLITGTAEIVDDDAAKQVHWQDTWKQFYEEDRKNYTLIRVEPKRLEILDTANGIQSDNDAWTPPAVKFKPGL